MKYNNQLVGISYSRSYKELDMWKRFLNALEVNYCISDINLNEAVELATDNFIYANEYCFTRKATLGEYLYLVNEKKCEIILVAARVVEGNIKCNTTRFMAPQISEYFGDKVYVIDSAITTDISLASQQLKTLASFFSSDEEKIQKAIDAWFLKDLPKKSKKGIKDGCINILFIGGAPFHFSFSDQESYMTRYLRDKLSVNVIGPKTSSEIKNPNIYRKAYKRIYNNNIFYQDRNSYWVRSVVLASYYAVKDKIDGVIFVRDKYCTAKIEEIDLLQKIIEEDKCPSIIVDYRAEARTSVETVLETFVEMLEWKRKKSCII